MLARPGIEKGRHVPEKHAIKELMADPEKMQAYAQKGKTWVQAGMKEDAEKQK